MIAVYKYDAHIHFLTYRGTHITGEEERTVYHVTASSPIRNRERGEGRGEKKREKHKENLLVSVRTDASRLVVLGAIIVGAVVEGAVPLSHRSAPPLVHEVPVEARERPVLRAFALDEEGTLVDAELLQVSGMRIHRARHYFSPVGCRALPSTLPSSPPRLYISLSLSLFPAPSFSSPSLIHVFLRIVGRARRV